MPLRVVCAGFLIRWPLGGHCWHHHQYLVGLQRLGAAVTYVETWGWEGSCYHPDSDTASNDPNYGIAFLRELLRPHGLDESWCFLAADGSVHGLSQAELDDRCREADLFINLSNANQFPASHLTARRALIDTDPVFTQIGVHGVDDPSSYDVRFSFAENLGRPGCSVPTDGQIWLPTRQPVVADLWPFTSADPNRPFTTVSNFGAYGEHAYNGRTYGQKDREWREIIDLPRKVSVPLEIAIGDADEAFCADLREHGWELVSAAAVSRSPDDYQSYVQRSAGEFSAAKHAYVVTGSGWFSERSCTYLASGRPVVVQDTGFSSFLPCGEGLVPFRDVAGAQTALESVHASPTEHGQAARKLAKECFGYERVLTDVLEKSL